ncbi:hypothetical protein V6N11_005325 [Hibiscus sabdariffa]|uniref:Uncharacterized protein n=1 Tax=Hibiscus sabdariffa TaxID=183260 RepID=A0ABR2RMF6_9ROSI
MEEISNRLKGAVEQIATAIETRSSRDVATAQEAVDCSKTERFPPVFNRFGQRRNGCDMVCVAGSSQSYQRLVLRHYASQKWAWFREMGLVSKHAACSIFISAFSAHVSIKVCRDA